MLFRSLSESTSRLSESSKARHPEIDWRRIVAFRNLLVHNYLGIKLERIWEIVQPDLPEHEHAAAAMLEALEQGG